jgi:hypothetical protein
MSKRAAPLLHDSDPKEIRLMIAALQKRDYDIRRPQAHHIKVGAYNFFPTTGKITIDPCTRHPRKGFSEFLEILENAMRPTLDLSLDDLPEIAPPLGAK